MERKKRIGQSIDIHQLVSDRPLIIGGVEIPYHLGLLGHSDADVLTHAIAEAIIGALGLGDLGKHFPEKDEQYRNISSLLILEKTKELMREHNYEIGNIDSLVLIEEPILAPYINSMITNLSCVLDCPKELINVKATRGEGLGFIGTKEGVVATAVVLLEEKENEES